MSAKTVIDPKYCLGIEEMDVQHARWIQLISEFRSAASGLLRDQAAFDAAAFALERLLDYTNTHFASEEAFLATRQYPDLEAHKRQHRELKTVVVKLLKEIREHSSSNTPLKLNLFVSIWLLEHIMQDDGKYARFILGQSAGSGHGN